MLRLLAHAVHLALVLFGLIGVVVLLLPAVRGSRPAATTHTQRVEALRASVTSGRLGTLPESDPAGSGSTGSPLEEARAQGSTWRPFAVISSAAAGIVHLAVFPHHLAEGLLPGCFFLAVAAWQARWAWQVSREATSARLWLGLAASVGLIALWGWSRATGLPFGLTHGAEPVGAWDLACIGWELAVIAGVLARTRCRARPRRPAARAAQHGRLGLGGLLGSGTARPLGDGHDRLIEQTRRRRCTGGCWARRATA